MTVEIIVLCYREKARRCGFFFEFQKPHVRRRISMERKTLIRAQKLLAFGSLFSRITTKAMEILNTLLELFSNQMTLRRDFAQLINSQMIIFAMTRGRRPSDPKVKISLGRDKTSS